MTTIDVNKDYITVTRSRQNDDGSTTEVITKYTDPKTVEIFTKADLNGNKKIDTKEELAKFEELKAEHDKSASQLDTLSKALKETKIGEGKEIGVGEKPAEASKTTNPDVKELFEKLCEYMQNFLKSLAELLGIKADDNSATVPAPTVENTTPAPTVGNTTPAPSVENRTPAPAVENIIPAPAPEDKAPVQNNGINEEQQKLFNDLKRLIDGKTEAGLSTNASKDSRVKDIFNVINALDANSLKTFFKENPEYVDRLYGQFEKHGVDEITHQISKKLVEARREEKGFNGLREIKDNAEKYADEVLNIDWENATPEYLSELADHVAASGRGGRVLQEINDFWFNSNTTKASKNLIKLLAMAD